MCLLQLVSTGQKLHIFTNTFHHGCKRTANVLEKIWTLRSISEGKGCLCVCTSVSVGGWHNSLIFISINSVCKHPDTAVFGCCTHEYSVYQSDMYKHTPLMLCFLRAVVAVMSFVRIVI